MPIRGSPSGRASVPVNKKMGKMVYTMGEVAEMFDVNQSLIRHWEKQFDVLRPKRNKKGNRLFSPQDVERLKIIYHLVKERGMTLDGARKALRGHRVGEGIPREVELMERLQRIRSLLAEVREELKDGPVGAYTERAADAPDATESHPAAVAAEAVPAEIGKEQAADSASEAESVQPWKTARPNRRPRRRKDDEEDKELFAFYEQSLF